MRRNVNTQNLAGMGRTVFPRQPYAGARMSGMGSMGDYTEDGTWYENDHSDIDPNANAHVIYASTPVQTRVTSDGSTIYTPAGNNAMVQNPMSAGPGTSAYGTGTIMDAFKQLLQQAPAVIGVRNMDQIQKMNMDLIRQGKPPLTASQIANLTSPVNIGLSPDTKNMMILGALALGAVMLISRKH